MKSSEDLSFLEPYVNAFMSGNVENRNRAVGKLMTYYQTTVSKHVEAKYGKDVAYDLAKAIWWEYQHRTEGCNCTSYDRW
jgi:hypothetical protein